jgi:hypothetical protein
MADRYPLIFDVSDNKLKEIPSGDNINLTGTGIVGVSSISCGGIITGRQRFAVHNNVVITTNVILSSTDVNCVLLMNTLDARTVTLPIGSSLQIGDWVRIVDVGSSESNIGNAYKKNIIITPNIADRIQGGSVGDTLIMDVDAQALTLMWCGSTYDWRIVN